MKQFLVVCAAAAMAPLAALAAPADVSQWTLSGDLRTGYFDSTRVTRDGVRSDADEFRARLRLATERDLSPQWRVRGRLAGRYHSDQQQSRFYLRGYAPTSTGVAAGDTTVDELYLDLRPAQARWDVRAGRFQNQFALRGVASKGLDRSDSSNVSITWTDGVHYRYRMRPAWQVHGVLQYNHENGPGSAVRAPLDFSDSNSRVTVFAALEALQPRGPLVQRMVGVTWMRDALAADGIDAPARQDYVTVTARGAAQWPLTETGLRFLTGAEIGYAPNTPRATVAGVGDSGDASGLAWQISANLYDVAPGHHVGVVYARIGGGWLLSGSFRGNDELSEIRYQWRFSRRWSLETRYRIREELKIPPMATRARVDKDFYLRVTGRF
jgi:opacity protein-like surface antigen